MPSINMAKSVHLRMHPAVKGSVRAQHARVWPGYPRRTRPAHDTPQLARATDSHHPLIGYVSDSQHGLACLDGDAAGHGEFICAALTIGIGFGSGWMWRASGSAGLFPQGDVPQRSGPLSRN
jgi:hypothetical protein